MTKKKPRRDAVSSLKEMILAREKPEKQEVLPHPDLRKLWRQAAKLSSFEAAEIISKHAGKKVSRSRLANWEAGLNSPTPDLLEPYKEFLEACREIYEEKVKGEEEKRGQKGSKSHG